MGGTVFTGLRRFIRIGMFPVQIPQGARLRLATQPRYMDPGELQDKKLKIKCDSHWVSDAVSLTVALS